MKKQLSIGILTLAMGASFASAQTFTLDGRGNVPGAPIGANPVSDTLWQPVAAPAFARFFTASNPQHLGNGGADIVNALTFGYDGQAEFGGNPVVITQTFFSVDRIAVGNSLPMATGAYTESLSGGLPLSDTGQASDIYRSSLDDFHEVFIDDNGFLDAGTIDHPSWLANGNIITGLGGSGDSQLGTGSESYNVNGLDMRDAVGGTGLGSIFYSVEGSADILRGAIGAGYNIGATSYATAAQLGLTAGDDISGLTIVDYDGDATTFNSAQDVVFFALARGSSFFSGDNQAGDIYMVGGGSAVPTVVIDEGILGFQVAGGGISGLDLGLSAIAVPEPNTLLMAMAGIGVLLAFRKRKRA